MAGQLPATIGAGASRSSAAAPQARAFAPHSTAGAHRCIPTSRVFPQATSSMDHASLNGRGSMKIRPAVRAIKLQASAQADATLGDILVPYETMIVLRPDMTEEERDQELAKFEAFLVKEGAQEIKAIVRGAQSLAYPIGGYWEGIYVLYNYNGKRSISQAVQKLLSTPVVGFESNILRHMTFVN